MSRPKPHILCEIVDPKTYRSEQVLQADAIYAVFYQGNAINLRTVNSLFDYPSPKYKRMSFGSPGHAFNLAEKLNKRFKTKDFQVFKLNAGMLVIEGEDI